MSDVFRIRIEQLENGYTVEVPDIAEMKKKKEAAAKAKSKNPGGYCEPYLGDCTSVYAAKTVKEVLKLVENALKDLPESEFDSAFEEAATTK